MMRALARYGQREGITPSRVWNVPTYFDCATM